MDLCCDPVLNLWGAYWPAWVACLVGGVVLTIVCHYLFMLARLGPHVRPRVIVYQALLLLWTCGLWLLLYRNG